MSWQPWQITSAGQINIWIEVFFKWLFFFRVSILGCRFISRPGPCSSISRLGFSTGLLWRHLTLHLATFSTWVTLATLKGLGWLCWVTFYHTDALETSIQWVSNFVTSTRLSSRNQTRLDYTQDVDLIYVVLTTQFWMLEVDKRDEDRLFFVVLVLLNFDFQLTVGFWILRFCSGFVWIPDFWHSLNIRLLELIAELG